MFVDCFQPRGGVDGVAQRTVVKQGLAAKVAHNHLACVHANAGQAPRKTSRLHAHGVGCGKGIHLQRAIQRPLAMVRLLYRGRKQHHHGVTHKAVQRTLIFENDDQHGFQIVIQQRNHLGRVAGLHHGREAHQVREHKAADLALATQVQLLGVGNQMRHPVGRHIARKRSAQPALLALGHPQVVAAGQTKRQRHGQSRVDRIQQQLTLDKGQPTTGANRCQSHSHNQGSPARRRCEGHRAHYQRTQCQHQRFQSRSPGGALQRIAGHHLLQRQGMGQNAGHGITHGVGTQIHEPCGRATNQHDMPLQLLHCGRAIEHFLCGDKSLWLVGRVVQPHLTLCVGRHRDAANAYVLHAIHLAAHGIVACALRHAQGLGTQARNGLRTLAQQQWHAAQHAIVVRCGVERAHAAGGSQQNGQRPYSPIKTCKPVDRFASPCADHAIRHLGRVR